MKKMLPAWAAAAACLVSAGAVSAQSPDSTSDLRTSLDALLDSHPAARRATVALKVVDLESGEVLYDRGGDKLLTPASNLKIYTAAAALGLLGPEHRWTTRVYARTVNGEPIGDDGVVKGSLVLVGGGDPMLTSADLAAMADRLVSELGVREVEEGVVVGEAIPVAFWDAARGSLTIDDVSWARLPAKGPGWMWDDEPDYYNMTITPLMVDFNVMEVVVSSGRAGDPAGAVLRPASDYPVIVNSVMTVGDPADIAAGGGPLSITRVPFEDDVLVSGAIVAGAEPVTAHITMDDPRQWAAGVFAQMLRDRGVKVGEIAPSRYALTLTGREPLMTHEGRPLSEAVKHFLKVSENAVGEMLLLTMCERFGQVQRDEPRMSWPCGAEVITDWLVDEAGLDPESFHIVDGSGLSRYNLISADSAVDLLCFMKRNEHFDTFFDSLVVYDVKLPAQGAFDGVPMAEFDTQCVFAKSGGMASVLTNSGYLKTLEGRWLAFSYLTNGYIGSNEPVRSLRDAVWTELALYRSEPAPANH